MELALRLGRTLTELEQTLPVRELNLWIAFDRLSPIGDARHDYLAAQVASIILKSKGIDADISRTLIQWGAPPEPEEMSEEAVDAFFNIMS